MAQEIGSLTGSQCKRCNSPTVWKKGRFGLFHACTRYPECRGRHGARRGDAVKGEPAGETCYVCKAPLAQSAVTEIVTWTDGTMVHKACDTGVPEGEKNSQDDTEPEPAPVTPPAPKADPGMLANFGAFGEAIRAYVDTRAHEIAQETLAKSPQTQGHVVIDWTVNDKAFAKVEGAHHKALPDLLALLKTFPDDLDAREIAGHPNFMLVGPAGSGKTKAARDLATALKRPFASISCTAGMPEWHLIGRSTPNLSTGENRYQASKFVQLYQTGGIFLVDEFDAADPNTVIVLNSALANGHMDLPTGESITRHPDFVFVASANTYGAGASRMYVGRNQLDASTLSRFAGGVIFTDYDRDLEGKLCDDSGLLARVWNVREKLEALKIRQLMGTRELLAAQRLVKGGFTQAQALAKVATPWTDDERARTGLA
jgi:ssDNA-binding Zn-finger/Zn-ribbon topoisomerase 1